MDHVAYAGLVAFGAFTTGMGVMAVIFYVRSMLVVRGTSLADHMRRHFWLAFTKAGIIATQSVLLYRIISLGQTEASGAALLYLTGLAVTGIGIMGQCATMYKDLPTLEHRAIMEKETQTERVARGERTLTAEEEHRREATEEVAAQTKDRESRSRGHSDDGSFKGHIEGTIEGEVK